MMTNISDLPPEMFEQLFLFLDFASLKSRRGVSKTWEMFARKEMMKRSAIDFSHLLTMVSSKEHILRIGVYSSWKMKFEAFSKKSLQEDFFMRNFDPGFELQAGRNVKYLNIELALTLDPELCSWLQQILTVHCPNVQELRFEAKDCPVGSNLRKLSIKRANVMGIVPHPSLGIPFLPKLTKMQIGVEVYTTVALSELVDAAPNLRRLEVSSFYEYCHISGSIEENDLWRTSPSEMKPHPYLHTFVAGAGVNFMELSVLKKTLKKFPNLSKLFVGGSDLELSAVFDVLLVEARHLEHLYWMTKNELSLSEMCDHLVFDVAKVSAGNAKLRIYHFDYATRSNRNVRICMSEYERRKEEIWQGMLKGMRKETRVILFRPFMPCNCGMVYNDANPYLNMIKEADTARCDALKELEKFIRDNEEQVPISFVELEETEEFKKKRSIMHMLF
jgi:hypothetical protein